MQDPILFWNQVALEANRISQTNAQDEQTGPTRASRALAIVHLAMYDAFAYIDTTAGLIPSIAGHAPPPPGEPIDIAIAAAAHTALSNLFFSQQAFFDLILDGVGIPPSQRASSPGHNFGIAVATAILNDRSNDPLATSLNYMAPQARGKHRVDPDNPGQGYHGAYYGAESKGFAITQRFELVPPPFDNNVYRDALKEVRGKGIAPELMGTLPSHIKPRTIDETLIGIFWAYDGVPHLGTPPRFYNQIIRLIASKRSPGSTTTPNSVAESARLFSLVNVAMADAGILAWDQKYCHEFWRPVLGIREHDKSMGPEAAQPDNNVSNNCDSQWLPMGAPSTNKMGKNFTPPFPAYPSGHATFGAAAFHIARLFYNQGGKLSDSSLGSDDLFDDLELVSDELNGFNADNKGTVRPRHLRNFPEGMWQMIEENGRSRVYLGVHWIFDAFAVKSDNTPDLTKKIGGKYVGGVPLGLQIAEDIFQAAGTGGPVKSSVGPRTTSC